MRPNHDGKRRAGGIAVMWAAIDVEATSAAHLTLPRSTLGVRWAFSRHILASGARLYQCRWQHNL